MTATQHHPADAIAADGKHQAAEPRAGGWWQNTKEQVAATWASDRYELYLPLYAWHNRSTYSKEKIKEFNENAWGIGFGKYRDTEYNTTHGIGGMVFMDSHNDPEPFVAYTWQKNWPISQHQKLAAGGFVGVTARSDIGPYAPIPVAWPYVAYSYRKFSLQGMYFPGSKGNGNIAFFWAKYRLD
ncbi:lipid IV(A) palmitoyltransferase PagP [Paralysiella testudinis]|uniref:Lipid IV(A) palmitoyltransferase PagP n=1 Tax=Paralysiella testudinis TaxID=2809020 RepID=A0A892ZHM1_9NEIS|nr:lipid IV(A) palmitoyltransferase PagP [Paralysiella testudinis]QRQ82133.1 lipid IV(A) palmitoyltransferase PagP [Paralysiella testudinis]